MNQVEKFSKYLNEIEYPNQKEDWNIAGIIKGQNAFYKFDVKDLKKINQKHSFCINNINNKADKIVLENLKEWVILDVKEINKYVINKKKKDYNINDLINSDQWVMKVLK
jgi:hypothetical protein